MIKVGVSLEVDGRRWQSTAKILQKGNVYEGGVATDLTLDQMDNVLKKSFDCWRESIIEMIPKFSESEVRRSR